MKKVKIYQISMGKYSIFIFVNIPISNVKNFNPFIRNICPKLDRNAFHLKNRKFY